MMRQASILLTSHRRRACKSDFVYKHIKQLFIKLCYSENGGDELKPIKQTEKRSNPPQIPNNGVNGIQRVGEHSPAITATHPPIPRNATKHARIQSDSSDSDSPEERSDLRRVELNDYIESFEKKFRPSDEDDEDD